MNCVNEQNVLLIFCVREFYSSIKGPVAQLASAFDVGFPPNSTEEQRLTRGKSVTMGNREGT